MTPKNHPDEAPTVRDRLLDAAEAVVARDGVGSLTLDAVARQAEVSKGGLLYHFPSKSALIEAVVRRLGSRCEADQAMACTGNDDRPGAFARAYISARSTPPDPNKEPIHTALLAAAGTDPQYLDPFRERLRQWQTRLENDGIDPVVATIVRLVMDGLCFGALLRMPLPEESLRRQVLERLMEMTQSPQTTEHATANAPPDQPQENSRADASAEKQD